MMISFYINYKTLKYIFLLKNNSVFFSLMLKKV